jgi:hypothetical protein
MAEAAKSRRKTQSGIRARRFPIHAPVRYRTSDGLWHRGTTENISRSGLLLHADEGLTLDTPIELVVELPPVLAGVPAARVVCRGRIVRTVASRYADGAFFAASITHCRFGRLA